MVSLESKRRCGEACRCSESYTFAMKEAKAEFESHRGSCYRHLATSRTQLPEARQQQKEKRADVLRLNHSLGRAAGFSLTNVSRNIWLSLLLEQSKSLRLNWIPTSFHLLPWLKQRLRNMCYKKMLAQRHMHHFYAALSTFSQLQSPDGHISI